MHIEPGVVDGAKIILSYATAARALGLTAKLAADSIRNDGGAGALVLRSVRQRLWSSAFSKFCRTILLVSRKSILSWVQPCFSCSEQAPLRLAFRLVCFFEGFSLRRSICHNMG